MHKSLTGQPDAIAADTLDHAREFVQIVMERTPAMYEELLQSPQVRQRLSSSTTFNDGKVLAWAQFLVFRWEFLQRFPHALASVAWGNNPGLVRESLEMLVNHAAETPVLVTVCGPGGVAVLRYPTALEAMSLVNSVGEVPVQGQQVLA